MEIKMTIRSLEKPEDTETIYINDAEQETRSLLLRLREVIRYRFLLQNMIVRDLKVRYKNSLLGILWSLLNPLLMMMVYTILFTKLIQGNDVRNFPVFVLVGLSPWNFFGGTLISGTVSVVGNSTLLKKVYFPRVLLPATAVFSNLVHFALALLVLLAFLYGTGIGLTIHALWVPVLILTQVIFLMGLSMLLGTLQVFYRDILMILDVVLLAWFFLTPVFYPFERLGESAMLFGISFNPAVVMRWINPIASLIDGYRTVLWGTMTSDGPASMNPAYLLRTLVTAVLVFIIGYIVFSRSEHLFGEKL
jgi:ABC-type polysaccharide/polyol phosphate export permease